MITTHVLDTATGRPAVGVPVRLERIGASPNEIGRGVTDREGRLRTLLQEEQRLPPGTYRLVFDTASYLSSTGGEGFFPEVIVTFQVRDATEHYHVPLLLSPFGYSTYRGS